MKKQSSTRLEFQWFLNNSKNCMCSVGLKCSLGLVGLNGIVKRRFHKVEEVEEKVEEIKSTLNYHLGLPFSKGMQLQQGNVTTSDRTYLNSHCHTQDCCYEAGSAHFLLPMCSASGKRSTIVICEMH